MTTNDPKSWEYIKQDVLRANTAQIVYQNLRDLEARRERVQTRWIWELLQNALDASADDAGNLICSIEYDSGQSKLIFQHNGHEFKKDEVAHLIYHGSTKAEDKTKIGQYGSGFLTTHLLSWKVNISGQLEDGQNFDFWLEREPISIEAVDNFMKEAADRFDESLSGSSAMPDGFTTRFIYPVVGGESEVVVRQGLSALKGMVPLIAAFNHVFHHVSIESSDGTISFGVNHRQKLTDNGIYEVTVASTESGVVEEKTYIFVEGSKATVATQVHQIDGFKSCLPSDDICKLFLGLPLIGTENFSFPTIINSFKFTPSDGDRDGVNLWLNKSDEANITNQSVITESFSLLVNLIRFMSSSGWKNVYTLAHIPPIVTGQDWIKTERLQQHISEQLINPIRQNPAVVCQYGKDALSPEEAILPFTEDGTAVEALWDLLSNVEEFRQKLPRRDEAIGWCNAVKSWADIRGCQPTDFGEAIDGRKLAELIDEQCDDLEQLRGMLVDDVCAVEWLDDFFRFLKDNGLDAEIRVRSVILDQGGYLDELSNLYRDVNIDDGLKDIADNLGLRLREFLRDKRLTSLADETGKGDKENKDVVGEITDRLNKIAATGTLDDKFADGSVRLFARIVNKAEWDYLSSFPVFSEVKREDNIVRHVIRLGQIGQDATEIPLAPVKAWPKDLQKFSDLFPPQYILADSFYDAISDAGVWQTVADKDLIRADIIISEKQRIEVFLPDEPLADGEHRTTEPVGTSDVVFMRKDTVGIMERIRGSRTRARLFWMFLTNYLLAHDAEGLGIRESACECGDTHRYYQARWLVPIAKNIWVPLGSNKRDRATAQSLANLLRDSDALPIPDNDAVNGLLEAIRISRFDLTRESMYSDDETREVVDNKLMSIMAVVQDDPDRLDVVPKFLEQLKEDEHLPEYLAERAKQRQTVHQNQQLGNLVESLVKQNLEVDGFKVEKTHVGADLIVRDKSDRNNNDMTEDDVTELKLSKGNRSWLVEVKSTRDNDARMTPAQARNAVEQGDRFLLCVVPVVSEDEPDLEYVRANMRFVEDIGNRVDSLCDDLDDFEQRRDDIVANYVDGFRLVFRSGTTRIRVDKSVWEDEGFCLSELRARLK